MHKLYIVLCWQLECWTHETYYIWGRGGLGSGQVRLFGGNRGSGRVNVSPGQVGSKEIDPWTTIIVIIIIIIIIIIIFISN